MRLILASQSPRRKQLLMDAAIDFEVRIADTDESFPKEMDYHEVPELIAKGKAEAVAASLMINEEWGEDVVVLAADTLVALEGKIIGKPKDEEDARQILSMLSGKSHEVITGVFVKTYEHEFSFNSLTKVRFNTIDKQQIEYYIKNYKPFDKAGAYAIQEWIGMVGVAAIEGDFYNVIGLPINKVVNLLNKLKG